VITADISRGVFEAASESPKNVNTVRAFVFETDDFPPSGFRLFLTALRGTRPRYYDPLLANAVHHIVPVI